MFNAPKQTNTATKQLKSASRDTAVTILTSGCHFSGKLFCRGSSRIGGKIEGQLVSEGLLIIEDEAQINAEVKADEVIIQGHVKGKLTAAVRVELCASSVFEGDISTPVLIVREGAQFNGRSTMTTNEATKDKGAKVLSAAGKGNKNHDHRTPDVEIGGGKQADVAVLKQPEVNVKL